MRVPVSWLRDYVDLPADLGVEALAERLTAFDLKLEEIEHGAEFQGPLVVGRVLSLEPEEHSNGKTINWCQVDVGPELNVDGAARGIVCGAHNFAAGDVVVCVLPGGVLPGGFEISARKTYGHVSDGMICSAKELGLGDEHDGIIVLDPHAGSPGDDAIALLGLRDDVLDLEVNPDRAYALSLRGVARDTAIAYGTTFHDPAVATHAETSQESYPVRVEDSVACPVFVARTVTGFDPTRPTPAWLARRVQLAGMRSISLAVDVTNYVMLELGQPIHGYDRTKLAGPIVVRRAAADEKVTTLDGVVRTLSADDVLITDDSGPIGLAGVMGGEHTELSESTTEIVIESANFDAPTIGRMTRAHRLPSEASKRFERGVDPLLAPVAAQRVADLLVEHGGGQVEPGVTVVGTPTDRAAIELRASLPSAVTGIAIAPETVARTLRFNGCAVGGDGDTLSVIPPSWRPDLTDPYDLVEEVLRVVGYDQVPSVLPVVPVGRGLTKAQRLRRRAGLGLAGAGFVEAKSFPFVGEGDWDALGLDAADDRRQMMRMENPLSAEQPGLATTLLPGLLRTVARNIGRGNEGIALFEIASVFLPKGDDVVAPIYGVETRPTDDQIAALDAALPDQPLHVALALSGDRSPAGWWGASRKVSWADAIEGVRETARVLGVEIEVGAATRTPWHPGRCASISVGGHVIGHAGELHPRVCKAFGLPARTAAAEFSLDTLVAAAPDVVDAPQFSTFPVAKEDVALVVDADVPSQRVADALVVGGGELLESVRLFDVYTGDQVPDGKKSLAFALRLRARDRTLTDEDTRRAREAAVAAAGAATGAVQRT